jgi:hypothetical protein
VQNKQVIERGLFDEELVPEELTQVRMGKIVKEKFPNLRAAGEFLPFHRDAQSRPDFLKGGYRMVDISSLAAELLRWLDARLVDGRLQRADTVDARSEGPARWTRVLPVVSGSHRIDVRPVQGGGGPQGARIDGSRRFGRCFPAAGHNARQRTTCICGRIRPVEIARRIEAGILEAKGSPKSPSGTIRQVETIGLAFSLRSSDDGDASGILTTGEPNPAL